MANLIRCMCCGAEYPTSWNWFFCDSCGFRVCPHCLSKHRGTYGAGYKCSQCRWGHMKYHNNGI